MYHKTKYPLAFYIYTFLLIIFSGFLLIKNVPISAIIFYDIFIVIIALMALKYSFVATVDKDKVEIRYFNLFKRKVTLKLSEIRNIEIHKGEVSTIPFGGSRKLRDRIVINLTNGNSEILTTENWKRYIEFIDIIQRIKKK